MSLTLLSIWDPPPLGSTARLRQRLLVSCPKCRISQKSPFRGEESAFPAENPEEQPGRRPEGGTVAATEVPTAREEPSRPSPLGWLQNPHVRFAQLVACGVLGLLLFTEVLWPAPIGVLILGAIDGSLLALLAVGLVLIYRANRIINFAQADLGAVGGLLGVLLIAGPHVPFFLAMFIGVATAVAIGALTEFLFVRRFAKAPRLILTVATIGIAQICAGGELLLPKPFGRDITPQIKRTPLDFFHFRITKRDPILFGGSHLLAVLVVTVATGALIAFF